MSRPDKREVGSSTLPWLGRGFDWEVGAPNTRRVLATVVGDRAVSDEVTEVIGAVARHGGGFYECQRLVAESLECVLKFERCEPPQPGGRWITELFEVGGAFAPLRKQTCRSVHGLTS